MIGSLIFMNINRDSLVRLIGGIAPNEVIARSEFEVHHQIVTD